MAAIETHLLGFDWGVGSYEVEEEEKKVENESRSSEDNLNTAEESADAGPRSRVRKSQK